MKCIAANVDITIIEGGTFDKSFQWKTGDPAVPVNLTGYTANMQIRSKIKNDTVLLEVPHKREAWTPDGDTGIYFYNDEYDTEYDAEDIGKWRIYLRDNDTLGLCDTHKEIVGAYDLFLYNPSGEAVLKQYGVATITPAVTRNE
jgi:hypothetical protein